MKQHAPLAFTLPEITVVISIIMVMASLGAGSYRANRQAIELDLQADKVVAALFDLREQSRSKTKCFGARFETGKTPQKIETDFSEKLGGCDFRGERRSFWNWPGEIDVRRLETLGAMRGAGTLSGTTVGAEATSGVSVLFAPPRGAMLILPEAEEVNIVLGAKNGDATKTVYAETTGGVIEKITNRPSRSEATP